MCAHGFKADASTTSMLLNLLQSKEQDPAPCFAREVHALTTSMSEFIKVQNIFKFPKICIIRYDV